MLAVILSEAKDLNRQFVLLTHCVEILRLTSSVRLRMTSKKTGDKTLALCQITLASNFSFSTSFVATSLGVPVRNSVFFVFVGT